MMKLNKKLLSMFFTMILVVSMTGVAMVTMINVASASPETYFYVDPPTSTAAFGVLLQNISFVNMSNPICSNWTDTLLNEYHVQNWIDTDDSGNLTFSDQIELNKTLTQEKRWYHVDDFEYGAVCNMTVSEKFTVDIKIKDAPDTYAWEIYLSWNATLLELFYIKQGDFLHRWMENPFPPPDYIPKYTTTFAYTPLDEANPKGETMIVCSLMGEVPWATGDGWLVSLGFFVEAEGSCVLDLFKTRLWDHISVETEKPASTYYPNKDGFFYNVDIHDVAITSVTASPTVVGPGDSVTITVTVKNEGNFSETFNVTVYADVFVYNMTVDWWPDEIVVGDEITVGTQAVTEPLTPGATTTLPVFTWVTTGVAGETYTISANVTLTSPTDDDPRDNMFIDGEVAVRWDHDLKVTDVTVLTPEVWLGELANMTVTVLNQGASKERNFNIQVNASETIIETITHTSWLLSGDSITYDISWDTSTGVATGTYTISGYVPPVSGEVDPNIADNLLVDGTVTVKERDLNITDVTVLTPKVYEGYPANINVTVLNEGTEFERFYLYVYADIDTEVIGDEINISIYRFLEAGANNTYTISWDTTGAEPNATYTISAYVPPFPEEVDTADNGPLIDGTVRVKVPGDVNGDGTVDGSDLTSLSAAFGSESGGPNWDEECDFNGDSKVDISDLFDLGENYGRSV